MKNYRWLVACCVILLLLYSVTLIVSNNLAGSTNSNLYSGTNTSNNNQTKTVFIPTTTPTLIPTATPIPKPKPNSLVIGDEADPLAEIKRYQPFSSDLIQEVSFDKSTVEKLNTWFEYAPKLESFNVNINIRTQPDTYVLKFNKPSSITSQVATIKGLPGKGIFAIARNPLTGQILSSEFLSVFSVRAIAPPDLAYNIISEFVSNQFIDMINRQFDVVNQKLDQIKGFLEDKDYSQLEGNLEYINNIRAILSQHKLAVNDVESFRLKLEDIELDSLQMASFFQTQMHKEFDIFQKVNLNDKNFIFFIDDNKVRDFEKYTNGYINQSQNYLEALTVRGLAAQVRCALPESRELCLTRIEEVRGSLRSWSESQNKFYDEFNKRIPKINGFLVDENKRNYFRDIENQGRGNTRKIYDQVEGIFSNAVEKVKIQIKEDSQPLNLLVKLDQKGSILDIKKLIIASVDIPKPKAY